ncbi:glycosyltransferase family 2 protein [Anaerorhabdus sp.]|uniref:glycosyltransferase family 2 protein n=1 Tax=Anaerorhabdus sp. TaxID=1872524 RepID=UPI002B21F4E8|nr:glycosyltransferase family 2 protein [Anaerorhabdus sp.]MEA4875898.1 glycosyltransferase family 2 protein [Anaerorhabdus sp.]
MSKILYLVIPCFNEEEGLEISSKLLLDKLNNLIKKNLISEKSKILLVDDGSSDKTYEIMKRLVEQNPQICALKFSRNFGHQNAVFAGMMKAKDKADMIISLDADLQQDINAIDEFLEKFYNGAEIVYGIRNDRKSDGLFKKTTATLYYKGLSFLGCKIIPNHADYRLMSKRVLEALSDYKEVNLFLRGLIPLLGFKSDTVYFDVKKRDFGKSKYTLKKMMSLAIDGVTSLSVKPIRLISILGIFMVIFSIFMIVFSIIEWAKGNTVPGYATSVISIWFVGGTITLSLGVIGEYVGRIYLETKQRPRYLIDEYIENDDKKEDIGNLG